MSKELQALEQLKYYNTFANDDFDMTKELEIIETALKENIELKKYIDLIGDIETNNKKLKVLEIIKSHILNRDMDTSGIYLEYHNGHYEPYYTIEYYTIEIKKGVKQVVSQKEHDLLKEVLQ